MQQPVQSPSTRQRNPLDYLKIVFRRKWLIVIPALIGLIGGIVAANFMPRVYQSSTLILVEEGRVLNPLLQELAVSTSVAQRLAILREQILGWDRMNQLISKLQLAQHVRDQKEYEDLVLQLRRTIDVSLRGKTGNLISISFEGKVPEEAMNIVKTITDIFIAENLRQQSEETENAISFINEELELYKKKLKQSEIAAMEDKLNKLLMDSTEKHPLVITLRQQIAQAKGEVDQGNYELTENDDVASDEMKSLKQELSQIKQELATSSLDSAEKGGENRTKLANTTNDKLYKLLLLERVEKVASNDMNVNKQLYDELLKRLETAKITQRLEASKEGTRYTILDPARLPLRPVKPNKALVLLAGLALGLCAGLGIAFGLEMFDHSFLGVEESKGFMTVPLLGAVSKIVTESDVRAQKTRTAQLTAISGVIGVVLTIAIILTLVIGG